MCGGDKYFLNFGMNKRQHNWQISFKLERSKLNNNVKTTQVNHCNGEWKLFCNTTMLIINSLTTNY